MILYCLIFSSEEEDEFNTTAFHRDWFDPMNGNQPRFISFVDTSGFKLLNRNFEKIKDIYLLLLNNEIFEIVVKESDMRKKYYQKNYHHDGLIWISKNLSIFLDTHVLDTR